MADLRFQNHPPQQVLEARVVAEGVNLIGRRQAFEFFKPVEDDVDWGLFLCCIFFHHQEPVPVRGNVVILESSRS